MDTLFYKVIHNKYLFNIILTAIQETEWVKYDRINDYHIKNKIKLKYITSLEFMVNNGLDELLKCKLENRETIEFDEPIIEWIFSFGKVSPVDGEECYYDVEEQFDIHDHYSKFGYYRDIKELWYKNKSKEEFKKQVELKYINFKKFQSLLYQFKNQLQLSKKQLFEIVIRNKSTSKLNIELVETIFNDMVVLNKTTIGYPTLVNSIKYSTPSIINSVLQHMIQFNKDTMESFISMAICNEEFKDTVIEYLIINHRYFTNKVYGEPTTDCKKSMSIMSMDSEIIYKEYLLKYDEIIESLQDKFNEMVISTGLKVHSVNILKGALKYHKQVTEEQFNQYEIKNTKGQVTNEFLKIYSLGYNWLEQVNLAGEHVSILHYFYGIKNQQDYEQSIGSILNIKLRSKFPKTWNSIYTSNTFRIIVKDKETVDWIFDNVSTLSNKGGYVINDRETLEYSKLKSSLVDQDHCQLVKENCRQFLDDGISYEKRLYTFAIYECNIEVLKQFEPDDPYETFKEFQQFYDPDRSREIPWFIDGTHQVEPVFNWVNQTADNLNQLLNYLRKTGYNHFTSNLYQQLLVSISTCQQYGELDFNLLDFKGEYEEFEECSIELFIDSIILEISPLVIQLFLTSDTFNESLNSLDLIVQMSTRCDEDIEDYSFYQMLSDGFTPLKHSCLYYYIDDNEHGLDLIGMHFSRSGESCDDIIQSIEIIFKLFNFNNARPSGLNLIQLIINYLYKRLIRVVNVDYEQHVDKMYKLISSKWFGCTGGLEFQFEHTVYHSFYYLGLKSLKLIKFILSIPSVKLYLVDLDIQCFDKRITDYESEEYYDNDRYDILANLNTKYYTYDYIFNSAFQDILESLIDDLVIQKEPYSDQYIVTLESTLSFLLEIREIQLFFKLLSKIQTLLDDINFKIGDFPSIKCYDGNSWNNTDYENYHDEDEIDPLSDRYFEFSYTLLQTIKFVLNEKSYNSFKHQYPNNTMFGGGSYRKIKRK